MLRDHPVVKANDLLRRIRRLATKRGWDIVEVQAKGSHLKVTLNGRTMTVPVHNKDVPPGTFKAIPKGLGLRQTDLEG